MGTVDFYLKEQLKAFTLILLANRQCTQEDILNHFESFSSSYTLAEGTLCVVLKELVQENKIFIARSDGETYYSLAISTDDLPIFALSGYTPLEVSKSHDIKVFESIEDIPYDIEEALIDDGERYAIYLKNNTDFIFSSEESEADTAIVNTFINEENDLDDQDELDEDELDEDDINDEDELDDEEDDFDDVDKLDNAGVIAEEDVIICTNDEGIETIEANDVDNNTLTSTDNQDNIVIEEGAIIDIRVDTSIDFEEDELANKDDTIIDTENNAFENTEGEKITDIENHSTYSENVEIKESTVDEAIEDTVDDTLSDIVEDKVNNIIYNNEDYTEDDKEGTNVQPIDNTAVMENEKEEVKESPIIVEEVHTSSTPLEPTHLEPAIEEIPAENEVEDPLSRKKKIDALKLLGFFDEPKSEAEIAREEREKEALERRKQEQERIARLKEEERKRQELLEKQAEEKAKEEEFSMQQALSTRKAAESTTDSSALQRKLSKYIENKEIENKYNFENIINSVFTDVPQPLQIDEEEDIQAPVSSYAELKDFMSNKGFTIKPYVNTNTFTYYSNNFIFTNKINRDVSIITYAFILIECLLGYFLIDKWLNKGFALYLTFALIGLAIPVFFLIKYFSFPTKRKEAVFKFRLSLATAFMIYANLLVLVVLFSVFTPALKVSTEDVSTMILPIFFPAVLLFNIPISVCIYSLLYRTKKYHLH